MFPVNVRDADGVALKISSNGEAATASLAYSEPYYARLAVDDQIYNVVPGLPGKRFILSGLLIATSKNIVGEKTVHVYEATSLTDSVHAKDVVILDMIKLDRQYLPLVNVAAQNGAYINAHCDDSEVDITVFGYYVKA